MDELSVNGQRCVDAQAVVDAFQVVTVRVDGRLAAVENGLRLPPMLLLLKPAPELLCTRRVHMRPFVEAELAAFRDSSTAAGRSLSGERAPRRPFAYPASSSGLRTTLTGPGARRATAQTVNR